MEGAEPPPQRRAPLTDRKCSSVAGAAPKAATQGQQKHLSGVAGEMATRYFLFLISHYPRPPQVASEKPAEPPTPPGGSDNP